MKNRILVVNLIEQSDAYPNAKYQTDFFLKSKAFDVKLVCFPTWGNKESWLIARFFSFLYAHFKVAVKLALYKGDMIYVFYPSLFVACLAYVLCPKHKVVLDAFISIYDTVVIDRTLIRQQSALARILLWLERQVYLRSSKVVVDTNSNGEYYSALFNVPASTFSSVPLFTNEDDYCETEYKPIRDRCRVLFVGTLVPLHGVEVIVRAVEMLRESECFKYMEFVIVGDGQCRSCLDELLKLELKNVKWVRGWLDSPSLAEQIFQADICLGVFGQGKAERVMPYKAYLYSCVGRAMISCEGYSSDNPGVKAISCEGTVEDKAARLASEIAYLCAHPLERLKLSKESSRYYHQMLSNKVASKKLEQVFLEVCES